MRLRKPGSRVSRPPKPTARQRAEKRRERKTSATSPAGQREALQGPYGTTGTSIREAVKRSGVELLGIARELVRIPWEMYLGLAERLGVFVLAAWLWLWPYLVGAWHLAGRGLAIAQRAVTPARATVAVAFLCAAALAGSQWADLSGISVGTANYVEVDDVAPAPQVSDKSVGSAHAWAGVPLAIIAALIVAGSASGRPKLARLLIPVGAVVVAISLFVDRPEGLDKGTEAIAYESVKAELLTGFWAQLVSGVVLILLAPVLLRALRPDGTKADTPARPGGGTTLSRLRPRRPRRVAEAGR